MSESPINIDFLQNYAGLQHCFSILEKNFFIICSTSIRVKGATFLFMWNINIYKVLIINVNKKPPVKVA